MPNPPDESAPLPSTGRTSKPVPPFVAPRTADAGRPAERTTPLASPASPATPQRRSTPLFVPPASLPPEEAPKLPRDADERAKQAAPASGPAEPAATPEPMTAAPVETAAPTVPAPIMAPPPAVAAPPTVPALPSPQAPPRETRGLVFENLEQPEISLRASDKTPMVGGSEIQVIAYDDANSSLQSNSAEGARLNVDGFELETTELSIEPSKNPTPDADLHIESFWAAEAFTPSARPSSKGTRETPRSITPAFSAPPADAPPPRRSAMDALRVEEVMPVGIPTPPNERVVTPHVLRGSSAPMSDEMPAMAAMAQTPAALEALKELEPWALAAPVRVNTVAAVADALERVARRIRNGEVRVRGDLPAPTDESALSAALQALGRAPHR